MSETLINLSLVVLACIYIGLLLGKRSSRKELSARVEQEREKIKAEVKKEHTELAVELHGELSKVRDSIIQSAHAYQNVVNAIGEKLAPWEEVQKSLSDDAKKELPLLIVEGVSEQTAAAEQESAEQESAERGSSSENEGPSLQEKAAQLVKEDRAASLTQKSSSSPSDEEVMTTDDSSEMSQRSQQSSASQEGETEAKPEPKTPNGAARFAH